MKSNKLYSKLHKVEVIDYHSGQGGEHLTYEVDGVQYCVSGQFERLYNNTAVQHMHILPNGQMLPILYFLQAFDEENTPDDIMTDEGQSNVKQRVKWALTNNRPQCWLDCMTCFVVDFHSYTGIEQQVYKATVADALTELTDILADREQERRMLARIKGYWAKIEQCD